MSENLGTLSVYQRMPDPLQAVNELGTAIAKSGMFGCGSIDQGKVFALECFARGMPPLTLAERYHVVQGKLMMKYDAMLAEFHALGGKHKIISRTEDRAEIQLTIDGESFTESLTWEQAQKEKYPFGKDGKVKDNWATPRGRRQMLWARVVSEGVRSLRPGVNHGRYAAEEIDDDSAPVASSNGQHKQSTVVEQPKATPSASVVEKPAATGEVIDGSFEVVPDGFSTAEQRDKIDSLFTSLGMTVTQIEGALKKRKVESTRSLTVAQADELINALESRVTAFRAAREPELQVTGDPNGATCGPCTAEQERRIKAAFTEWFQIDKDTAQSQLNELTKKLHAAGMKGIIGMSANDAARLYDAIQVRKLDGFFARSLEQWRPAQQQQPQQTTQQQAAA